MITGARVVDVHGMGNWSGRWVSPYATSPIAYQLDDLQAATALARAARLILSDADRLKNYGHRARDLKHFVQHDVVDKLLDARGSETWFRTERREYKNDV
jgi:hypothetical protein